MHRNCRANGRSARRAKTEDKNVTKRKIGILGAGTWGMALARMLCVSGNDVLVWSALGQEIDNLSTTRVHPMDITELILAI